MQILKDFVQFLKDLKPATKMFAMGCLTVIILSLIGAAAYTGNFDLLLSLFDKGAEAKK